MPQEKCLNCRRCVENLKVCSKCKMARYCGPSCQKAAWFVHKKCCKVVAELRPFLKEETNILVEECPFNRKEGFSWPFVRFFQEKEMQNYFERPPAFLKRIFRALKIMACVEENLEAAEEFVFIDWALRMKYVRCSFSNFFSHVSFPNLIFDFCLLVLFFDFF